MSPSGALKWRSSPMMLTTKPPSERPATSLGCWFAGNVAQPCQVSVRSVPRMVTAKASILVREPWLTTSSRQPPRAVRARLRPPHDGAGSGATQSGVPQRFAPSVMVRKVAGFTAPVRVSSTASRLMRLLPGRRNSESSSALPPGKGSISSGALTPVSTLGTCGVAAIATWGARAAVPTPTRRTRQIRLA